MTPQQFSELMEILHSIDVFLGMIFAALLVSFFYRVMFNN